MPTIQFERASGRLKGPNVPPEATKLSPQYAHFTQRRAWNGQIDSIRDLVKYQAAYDMMWTTLCMQIDFASQRALSTNLTTVLPRSIQPVIGTTIDAESGRERNVYGTLPPRIPGQERQTAIATYWHELIKSSVYPFYLSTRSSLEHSGYGAKTVDNWEYISSKNHHYDNCGFTHNEPYLEAEKIFPFVHNSPLVRIANGYMAGIQTRRGDRSKNWVDLQDQLKTAAAKDLMGYTSLLAMLNLSRTFPQDLIKHEIDTLEGTYSRKERYEVPSWAKKIERMLMSIEPYHHFQMRVDVALQEWERAKFGEQAPVAAALWRTVVNLRYSQIKSITDMTARRPLVDYLLKGDYDEARYHVEDLMARYPKVAPDFLIETLSIDPSTLRGLYEERRRQIQFGVGFGVTTPGGPRRDLEQEAREQAQRDVEPFLEKDMVSGDGRFTLKIVRRVRHVDDGNGQTYDSIVHYIKTNDLPQVHPQQRKTGLVQVEQILPLIEKFGFSFVDPEGTDGS